MGGSPRIYTTSDIYYSGITHAAQEEIIFFKSRKENSQFPSVNSFQRIAILTSLHFNYTSMYWKRTLSYKKLNNYISRIFFFFFFFQEDFLHRDFIEIFVIKYWFIEI